MLENEDLSGHFEPQFISHISEGPTIEIITADFDKLYATSKLIPDGNQSYALEMEIRSGDGDLLETRSANITLIGKEGKFTSNKSSNPLTAQAFENTIQWVSNTLGVKLNGEKTYIPWDKEIPSHMFLTFNRQIHAISDEEGAA